MDNVVYPATRARLLSILESARRLQRRQIAATEAYLVRLRTDLAETEASLATLRAQLEARKEHAA